MICQSLSQPIYTPTIIPTTLLPNPQYQFNSTKYLMPNTISPQPLSPINYIQTQGKLASILTQSPEAEVGGESDEDSCTSPDAIPYSPTTTLNRSAKPFNPNKKSSSPSTLAPIIEVEDTSSMSDTSSNCTFTPINYYENIIKNGYDFLNTIPKPPSFSAPNPCISMTSMPVNTSHSVPNPSTQPITHSIKVKQFIAKFNNHAKGNFYISKEMIAEMVSLCAERFDSDILNDEKLAFGYFKESVAMQINDKEIKELETCAGNIIIIYIDLHFKNGDNMYLIAMENDAGHNEKVKWKINDFMTAEQIFNTYKITAEYLPKSSRNTRAFIRGLNTAPVNVDASIIYRTDFSSLPTKKSKRNEVNKSVFITERDLKYYCEQSWNDSIIIPVVVIKGKRQWIEWKKFICIYDRNGYEQWIGISMRYYESIKQWKIECMDYDAGRIWYQYRLVGQDNVNDEYKINYSQLKQCITTSLNMPKRNKGYKKRY